jgi:hypothetical protein
MRRDRSWVDYGPDSFSEYNIAIAMTPVLQLDFHESDMGVR